MEVGGRGCCSYADLRGEGCHGRGLVGDSLA